MHERPNKGTRRIFPSWWAKFPQIVTKYVLTTLSSFNYSHQLRLYLQSNMSTPTPVKPVFGATKTALKEQKVEKKECDCVCGADCGCGADCSGEKKGISCFSLLIFSVLLISKCLVIFPTPLINAK